MTDDDSLASVRHQTASAVVLDDDDRVLLVRHVRSGLWLYPGGHTDADEDPAQAAVREVREETGVEVRIVGPTPFRHDAVEVLRSPFAILEMPVSDPTFGSHRHIDMVYVCEPISGEITLALGEVERCEWVAVDRVADLHTPPELPSLVAAGAAYRRESGAPDDYTAFLRSDDESSRPFRARRLEVIARAFGEPRHLVLPGGMLSGYAFEEARHAYIHGLYIATVLLTQTALEHMLAGLLRIAGHDEHRSYLRILKLARDQRLISEAEFELFDRLRLLRNPYVHARPPLAPGTLGRRSLERGDIYADDDELMEEDATTAIMALLGIIQRQPFTVVPP